MSIIRMDVTLYDEIVQYAKEHLPEEACGLIAGEIDGDNKTIKKVSTSMLLKSFFSSSLTLFASLVALA